MPSLDFGALLHRIAYRLPWSGRGRGEVSVARAVTGFAIAGLVAMAIIALGTAFVLRRTATDQAIQEAELLTQILGRAAIEPVLQDSILDGDPAAIAALDAVVRGHILSTSVVRVKLWTREGLIVYSDEPRLIGEMYPLDEEDLRSFDGNLVISGIDSAEDAETRFDREFGTLLEVYLPVHSASGEKFLFEAYLPYSEVAANSNDEWLAFLPALISGLVLLELLQLPLAFSLASRLRHGQRERETLLHQAIESSDRERRIIASELHDGVVQDLVGHAYRITATADRLKDSIPAADHAALRQASAHARRTIQELRSLLVDLYPPNLRTAGLEAALSDVVAPLAAKEIEVNLVVPPGISIPEHVERLLYRGAREAIRNVQEHANADSVQVTVVEERAHFVLEVSDNGRGFDPAERQQRRREGHLGLDLLDSLVRESGGSLILDSRKDEGVRLTMRVPRQ